jgi:hypothetical protein
MTAMTNEKWFVTSLSPAAIDVLEQLFVSGPTWDGNLVSKSGRTELVRDGLAFAKHGYNSLTAEGINVAATRDVNLLRRRRNKAWYTKVRTA